MSGKVVLAGASGLVGGQVARMLSSLELHLIGRRKIEGLEPDVIQHVADPSKWPELVASVRADTAISCLGSTIKKAGSKAAFHAIDHDLILSFAAAAHKGGTRQFIMVSSVGADTSSSNFYLSTKGKAEDGLRALDYDRLDLMRPGLLRGDRLEQRTGESIAMLLSPLTDALMHGPLRRYRSIDSAAVARAIVNLTGRAEPGVFIHENDAMAALAS